MNKSKAYKQLQVEDRITIASLLQQNKGVNEIARLLKRAPSSITRELKRNTDASTGGYRSDSAQSSCKLRRTKASQVRKLETSSVLWIMVCGMLDWRWSPQQISGTLKQVYPEQPEFHVSHETIYNTIYAQARGELKRQLVACLRHHHSKRMPRSRGTDRRGKIADMVSIHVRPPEVEDRLVPGHWEGDFIKGAGNKSSVGVLVERTSRLVLLAKMDDATALSALKGFSAKLNSIPEVMRKSFTYDQGKEMSLHKKLEENTLVKVFFCDPHSPWQRGSCENTNGLLRQYLPKGSDLSIYSQEDLDAIADSLNTRPRATHNFASPIAVFSAMLEKSTLPVSQIH
jgi:IS30 family transposase